MKISVYILLIFLILIGLIGSIIKTNIDVEDYQKLSEVEKFEQNKKIEELEKEIRILKIDIDILNYGYRIGEEDAKKNK